jgi:hypothetical protein
VADHRLVLASLLEQKPSQGGLHQAVLVPLRMLLNKPNHRFEQISRELVFHTHVFRHVVGNRLHRTSLALTHPSAHGEPPAVKTARIRLLDAVANLEALRRSGFAASRQVLQPTAGSRSDGCQGEKRFPDGSGERLTLT